MRRRILSILLCGGSSIRYQSEDGRFQGLVPVSGHSVNMPTVTLSGSSAASAAARKKFCGKEWGDSDLSPAQDALRELMEYDLHDSYEDLDERNTRVNRSEEEAFLESQGLHATLSVSSDSDVSPETTAKMEKLVLEMRKKLLENPFKDVKIARNDPAGDCSLQPVLSVDVPAKKIRELLNDYENKRCKLCSESYQTWHIHQGFIPHTAREAIVFELLRPYCGTPDDVVRMWWWRLHHSKRFRRMKELSHNDSGTRRKRLFYLLKFLRDNGVLRESFNVNHLTGGIVSSGRSWEFERLEFIGDNVVKYLFNDRFNVLFPVHEGGVRGKSAYCQFMIDGNDGLARAYDYFGLSKLTESDKVISKFKSDVVETLFGELQLYIWSTELDYGVDCCRFPMTPEFAPLKALVTHVMEELGHIMIMYHIEYICRIVNQMVNDHNIKFIRSDPAMRTNMELQKEMMSAAYSVKKMSSAKRQITKDKIAFPFHDAQIMTSQFHLTLNKSVQNVGGLLPRAFPRSSLSPNPLFLDHMQMISLPVRKSDAVDLGKQQSQITSEKGSVGLNALRLAKTGVRWKCDADEAILPVLLLHQKPLSAKVEELQHASTALIDDPSAV